MMDVQVSALPGAFPAQGMVLRAVCCIVLLSGMNAAFWAPALADVLSGFLEASPPIEFANRDFANYWLSGRLAHSGNLDQLATQVSHQSSLEAAFGLSGMEPRNWSYPPHMLLVTWPLGFFSYPVAYILFMILTGGWFVWTVRSGIARTGVRNADLTFGLVLLLLAPFICLQVLAGQNGFFFGAALLQALLWRKSRPVAAGLMIALLSMKPQLGIMLPVLLLFERRFATILWTVLFSAGLVAWSVLAFGAGPWATFFEYALPYQQYVAAHWEGQFLYMMPTWFGAFRAAGLGHETALWLHLAIALPLVAAGVVALWRNPDPMLRACLALACTFVLTPYAFTYDLGALLALVAIRFVDRAGDGPGGWVRPVSLALVFGLPLWTPLLGRPEALLLLPPFVLGALLLLFVLPDLRAFNRPDMATGAARVP